MPRHDLDGVRGHVPAFSLGGALQAAIELHAPGIAGLLGRHPGAPGIDIELETHSFRSAARAEGPRLRATVEAGRGTDAFLSDLDAMLQEMAAPTAALMAGCPPGHPALRSSWSPRAEFPPSPASRSRRSSTTG